MTSEPDIVIVGAGAAGIGAARRLSGCGLSVIMLEALSRPGGRAWTKTTRVGALDLGCGWLHSADRNPWTRIAENAGYDFVRSTAWSTQFQGLGFPPHEHQAARRSFAEWTARIKTSPPLSDRASDALDLSGRWTAYLQAMSGFISGDELERISARDYAAYDTAATNLNWRLTAGYGSLITASLAHDVSLHLSTNVTSVSRGGHRVELRTSGGSLRPRAVILTMSTNVLSGDAISWPTELEPWREAAACLPLGNNEKLFLEIVGESPFEPETHVLGDPTDALTGTYYIRPFGLPVIECYLGGAGARVVATDGSHVASARAIEQLKQLFGASTTRHLRPLVASDWTRTTSIGGAYSHALPGHSEARLTLARPYENRIFFAGEATETSDFSTAHGAFRSGVRAAEEALKVFSSNAEKYDPVVSAGAV
jgi:monoamine oxidase